MRIGFTINYPPEVSSTSVPLTSAVPARLRPRRRKFVNSKKTFIRFAFVLVLAGVLSSAAHAQDPTLPRIGVSPNRILPIATGNSLYCAGYIQSGPINTDFRIVGANGEADQHQYAQNDYMYINLGYHKGAKVGDMYSVVRPRGQVKSEWSSKSNLGFYVQEVGALQIVDVKNEVSVAKITRSCDTFQLGDLIQPIEVRNPPSFKQTPSLDLFASTSGGPRGRIVLARDHAEMLARDFIVYVDLGAEDHVQVGDRLTIFRPLGEGNVYKGPQRESVTARDYLYQSRIYKGGTFSNQAGGKRGEYARGKEMTTAKAKEGRPDLRKVLGEAVVVNVKEKTATVVITRDAQEIHTGDWVEVQWPWNH